MKTSSTIRSVLPSSPKAWSGMTPTSAIAKTSSGKARKMSISRLMSESTQPPKKPAIDAEGRADDHRQQGGQEGDEQRDAGAVDDPAEDVAPVDRLDAHQVVPAHARRRARSGATGAAGVDEVLVELVRRVAQELHDERREDRDEDQEDQEDRATERDLVRLSRRQAICPRERPSMTGPVPTRSCSLAAPSAPGSTSRGVLTRWTPPGRKARQTPGRTVRR